MSKSNNKQKSPALKYSKKNHGYGYDGIYKFICEACGCSDYDSHEVGSYQGDAIVFFKKPDGKFGLLNHCYGSCSGCDSYQGSDRWDSEDSTGDLIELADHYKMSVQWFDSKDEFIDYCTKKWLAGDAGYHIDQEGYVKVMTEASVKFAS